MRYKWFAHHQSYNELVAAADNDCALCAVLQWNIVFDTQSLDGMVFTPQNQIYLLIPRYDVNYWYLMVEPDGGEPYYTNPIAMIDDLDLRSALPQIGSMHFWQTL